MSLPPAAKTKPHLLNSAHGTRTDPYFWLRDDERKNPEVLEYLHAEKTYADQSTLHLQSLQDRLYQEINSRIEKDDTSVPYFYKGYFYQTRYEGEDEYPIYARRYKTLDSPEEILLNGNELAKGHDFYDIGDYDVTLDNKLMAWTEDTTGRRIYTIRFRDLQTGEILPDHINGTQSSIVWADDNKTLFYIEKDPETLLGIKVRRHTLGTSPADDALVYEEADDSFYMSLSRTGDDYYIVLSLSSTVSDEMQFLPANDAKSNFTVLLPRQRDHEYDADHLGTEWVIRTNWQAENFRLMTATDEQVHDQSQWLELIAHSDDVYISDFDIFKEYLAIAERRDGLRSLRVLNRAGETLFPVAADDPAYVMDIGANMEADSEWLRYSYTSLTAPETIYEINMRTRERKLLKRQPVPGGFKSENYRSERIWVPARDGTKIPVSLLYQKNTPLDGTAPLYQYAYGAYGLSEDPAFEDEILSLVDRGFIYAIAHVRGGQELGRHWYEKGRLLEKLNTFHDFIDVTEYLGQSDYAATHSIIASGGSAGGLLVGAIANMRPDLYRVIVADVPFVDVVTTMMDTSIPLTTNEYDEWGNPNEKKYYDYMLKYSPYDNVKAQAYPAMLVTTGLWDSQVQYFEPAKWVAKLRACKTDQNLLLLHINMDAGHGGQSGRFRRNKDLALEYAFVLEQLGLTEKPTYTG